MKKAITIIALSLAACSGPGCKNNPDVKMPTASVQLENLRLPIRVYFRGLPSEAAESLNLAIRWWHRMLAESQVCREHAALNLCQQPLFELTNAPNEAFIVVTENGALPVDTRAVTTNHADGSCTIQLGPDWVDSTVVDALGRCIGLNPYANTIRSSKP